MNDVRNATPSTEPTDARWVKSSHSGPTGGNCVEVTSLAGGTVAVRDSRHPAGPALVFSTQQWSAFVAGAREGDFG